MGYPLVAKYFLLCCLILMSAVQIVTAGSAPVILDDTEKTVALGKQLATFKAQESGLNLQQVTSPTYTDKFKPNKVDATNYGYHDGDFWLRFELKAAVETDWHLVLDYVVFGEAELFLLPQTTDQTKVAQDASAFFIPPIARYRTPVWKLSLPPNQQFSAYLRIKSFKEPLVIKLKLMSGKNFLIHSQHRYIFFTMVITGLIILAIYNLFLAISLRERSYFVFVLFILLACVFVYRHTNLFPSYNLLLGHENRYYATLSFLTHAVAFYYWHMLHRNTDKLLEKCTKLMTVFSVALAILTIFYHQSASIFLLMFIPALLVLPTLMIRAVIKGHRSTPGAFLSMTCVMGSIAIYSPLYTGYFPTYPLLSLYIGHIGILLSMLLFSISHADRTRQLSVQAERVEAKSKATHDFLTTMSHELRTPMHTILSVNQLLKTTPLNPVQKNYLNSSEFASRQMMSLIGDVLDTAKLHSPHPISVNNDSFNLHQLLENIEGIFSLQAQQKQLSFVTSIKDKLPHNVIGDAKHLNQVLTNLISNAIKYTQHGEITLQVSTAADSTQQTNNRIYFAVHDTGPGIPTEHHALIFQPFYQTDSRHSRRNDGAGLGLAISHKLVQEMGGELQLNSTLHQGCCFFFTLELPVYHQPRSINTDQDTAPGKSDNKPLAGLKILLVDDSELNLMIGEKLLVLNGADVVLAQGGKEAMEKLAQQTVDLVLMDISMPDIDGYQTTQLLRENKSLSELPVIALTAHAIAETKARCLEAGMNDYLSKPFQTEQLIQLIRQYCPD